MISQRMIEELDVILKEDYGLKLRSQILSGVANGLTGFFGLLAGIDSMSLRKEHNDENSRAD